MKETCCKIINPLLLICFLAVEFLVLVALKLVQAIYPRSIADTYLMFSAILINAVFMLILLASVKRSGKALAFTGIPLAILTTLLADVFLVLLKDLADADMITFLTADSADVIGFFIFGIVQVIYAIYLTPSKLRITVRVLFYVALLAAVYFIGLNELGYFVACLSMSQLVLNLVYGWIDHSKKRTRASLLLAIGLSLFFLCDSFIMLRMLLPSGSFFYEVICFMVWVFYIPSQAVLSTSYLADRADA